MNTKRTFIVVAMLFTAVTCMGQLIPYTGQPILTIYQGTPVLVNQTGIPNPETTVSAQAPGGNDTDLSVLNRLTLGVDVNHKAYFASPMNVRIRLEVQRWNAQMVALTDTVVHLDVQYNPFTDTTYMSRSSARFSGAYSVKAVLDSIYVNGIVSDSLPAHLFINNEILVHRRTAFTSLTTPLNFSQITAVNTDCDAENIPDHLHLAWENTVPGIQEYQLEWLHVNNYGSDPTSTQVMSPNALSYHFKYNSTRITTSNLSYELSLIFDKGWVVFRVRGVGVNAAGERVYGAWNLSEAGTVASAANNRFEVVANRRHEHALNWQYATTYAEEGKKKEIISYFDGSLRNRQSVTQISTDQNTIVGETIYDYQGRPAINVLPVPVVDPSCQTEDANKNAVLRFYPNFNQNYTDSPSGYSAADFDVSTEGSNCSVAASPMGTQKGASQYYSPENPDKTAEQAYVPDAKKFPFTQVEYTPDNTGRIRRQGGVGEEFQLGSQHETTYLYGQPNQLELDRLFGSEVGDAKHYKKNVVIDANGQASISYLDQEGRVIATALAGDAPSNLQGITSEAEPAIALNVNAFGQDQALNTLAIEGNSLVFSTQLLVPYVSDYTFEYGFSIEPLQDTCLPNICIDCAYDLTLELVDECGADRFGDAFQQKIVGKFTENGDQGYTFHGVCASDLNGTDNVPTISISQLERGSYSFNKRLTINEEARQAFLDLYLNDSLNACVKTYEDFYNDELAQIDSSQCRVTCEQCFTALGTLEDYIEAGNGNAQDYYLQKEDCERLCQDGTTDLCTTAYNLMQMDMAPGGQYGEYQNAEGQTNLTPHVLSIYRTPNSLPAAAGTPGWRFPKLKDSYGEHPIYTTMNGDTARIAVIRDGNGGWTPAVSATAIVKYHLQDAFYYVYPQELASVEDFIANFEFSWAKSLVTYHPEYAYYDNCIRYQKPVLSTDTYTSDSFDALLDSTNTFEAAVENGLIPQAYAVIFNSSGNATVTTTVDTEDWFTIPSGTGSNTHAWDPFVVRSSSFTSNGCINADSALQTKFNAYQVVAGVPRTMPQIAAYMVRCGNNFYSNPQASCFDFGAPVAGSYSIDILNAEWNALKALYRSQKQQLKHELADCIALTVNNTYCGCIGNEDYNPYTSGMITPFTISNPSAYLNSPYFQSNQACGASLHTLFEQKDRRFPNTLDVVPIQNANDAAYELYLATGQCPVPFALQTLLSQLASDQKLDNTLVTLNDYSGLNALFQAANDFNMPGTIPILVQTVSISGNILNINWLENPGATVYATLQLSKSGTIAWDQLKSIINLYPSSGNTFTAQAVDDSNNLVNLTGSITHFNIQSCSFSDECTLNELGSDIEYLFSTLASTGKFTSTTAVAINPLVVSGSPINGLQTLLIQNAANASNSLSWIKVASNEFKLYNAASGSNQGLYVTFTNASPAGFNWAQLSQVTYFDQLLSKGQHLFGITAHLNNGTTVALEGTMIRKDAAGNGTGIPVGKCGLPVPMECQTDEHKAFDALYQVLNDVLVVQDFNGTQTVNLFTSMHLESSITQQWDPGVTATTSAYTSSGDTLTISAGECKTILTAAGSQQLTQVNSLGQMRITGTTDPYFNYHAFEIDALFNTGAGGLASGTIYGTTCLSIQQCYGCIPDALSPVVLEGIRQQRLADGSYYLDKSVEFYTSYVAAIDSFNLANNLSVQDTAYLTKKDYNYFAENGFQFPMPAYLRYLAHAKPGIDAMAMLRNPDRFVSEYGYGTNVLFEHARYKKALLRYNTRAQNSGAPQLTPISKQTFTDARVARDNGSYITYLETQPQGSQGGQDIVAYLGATATATAQDQILYKQYSDAYLAFESAQLAGTGAPCTDFKRFAPLYAMQDIAENNLFCSTEGRQQFQAYIAEIGSTGCPGMLPARKACLPDAVQVTIREDQKLYMIYKQGIKQFNQSLWATANAYTLPIAFKNVHKFILSNYKAECLKAYLAYLASYTNSTNPNLPSLPPLAITEFAPCNGVLAPEEPCKEAYTSYLECVRSYNDWVMQTNASFYYKEIPNYETFVKYDVCGCVGEFCARLQEIKDGLKQFSDAKTFYAYLDYRSVCSKPCDPGQDTTKPILPFTQTLVDDCIEMLHNQAVFNAQHDYADYIDSLTSALVNRYNEHCLAVNESLTYSYKDKLYHFTLYYYDQAGNLIKTIPPAGVERLNTTASADALSLQIASDRTSGSKTVYTSHRMATSYEYNSLNQLVAQSTPDTDPMSIFELTLPNGLNNRLITRKIQMVNENIGFLAGEVPSATSGGPVRGYLYKTTDGGVTWNRVYHLTGTDLKKAVMLDETTGFAIGTNGIVLKTLDGGNGWDLLNSWSTAGMIVDLNDITYVSNGANYTVTIVGANGLVAQSTNLQNFTAISVGTTWDLTSISKSGTHYFATANSATSTATATLFTKPLVSGTWTQTNAFSAGTIRTTDMISGNKAAIAGADGRLFVNPDISNTGSRWQLVETDLTGMITDIQFYDDLAAIALVDQKLYRSVDGGHHWQQVSNDTYTYLSESSDGMTVLAVGPNSRISLLVKSNNLNTPVVHVPFTVTNAPISAGWIDRKVSGVSSVMTLVVSTGSKLYITSNGGDPLPNWSDYDLAGTLSGASFKDLQFERVNTTGNALRGAVLSTSGRLIRINTTNSGAVQNATLLGNASTLFTAIAKDSANSNVYAYRTNGSLVRLNLGAASNNLTSVTTAATVNQECMVVKGNSLILAGNEIRRVAVPGGSITIQTNSTNPTQLLDISIQNGFILAAGTDGTLYRLESGIWKLVRTATNKDIYAAAYHDGNYYLSGENGYATKGTITAGVYTPVALTLTSGGSVESSVAETLYDLALNGDRMYAVGQQGRVLYSPNPGTSAFAKLAAGTENLYGVTPKINSTKVLVVGAKDAVLEFSGAQYLVKKELFTPKLIDVHFATATTGTILADKFTIRTTNDGGTTWNILKPAGATAPTAAYSEVVTINTSRSMLFGQGLPLNSSGNTLQIFTMIPSPQQVSDVEVYQNTLYILNTNAVQQLNLSNGTNAVLPSLGGSANAIEVLNNGSFAVAGEDGYFNYFDANGSSIFSASIGTEDINDLKFIDNTYAVAVGDNGAYYKFTASAISPSGYPTGGTWAVQNAFFATGTDPLGVNTYGQVNIYSIAFGTPVHGVFGGEYLVPAFAGASHCYVRRVFDPNGRYSSRFFYDRLGRLVVSQNARQYNVVDVFGNTKERQYSYTLYDALGRVVEVGEKTENPSPSTGSGGGTVSKFIQIFGTNVSGYYNPSVIDDVKLLAWIAGTGARKEVTKSYYDKTVITGLPASFAPNPLTQRKRITHVTYEEVYDEDDQTYAHATHYDYDIHGNVKTLLQDNRKMATAFPSIAGQRFKRLDYTYDLVSGNVHRMSVQDGESDQWHHAYRYDADNRIISAHTSTEKPLLDNTSIAQALENELTQNTDWQQDAKYLYYDHGPLARVELGNNQLQGMDNLYNLQGWMKGINATSLEQNRDPGKDGVTSNLNEAFAKDVIAFSLHYFEGDYQPIAAGGLAPTVTDLPAASITNSDVAANSTDLYNGNIKAMQTTLTHPVTGEVLPMANAYRYDQLNRLLESKSFINLTANQWGTSGMYENRYLNTFEYDAMGNIVHQNRYTQAGVQIENMSYGYKRDANNHLLRNRLYHINEPDALTSLSDSDIDNMGATFNPQDVNIEQAYNYSYDEEGRLVKDMQEKIANITWRVDGKVKEIQRPTGSGKKNVSFDYDAMGNRIAKHVYDDDWNLEKSTYYVLDAQGNQLNVYEHEVANVAVSYNLREHHIYGSSSLGIFMDSVNMISTSIAANTSTEIGHKTYSMSNHLGNVLTVISDIKIPLSDDGIAVSSYAVRSRTISDYTPFGVLLKERTVESAFFRTGFQGQERDDEVGGNGNHYTAEYWEFNPRIGKRWDRDPVVKYHESPYACFANNPIWFKDPDGADTTLDISSRALINDLIDPNSSNYNSAYAADFQKLVNDKTTLYSFVQWPGAKKEARDDGTTGVTYGQLSASGKNSSGQHLVNVEYSLETTTQGHKLDALFEESDHAVQFLNQRIGFYENPNVPGDFIVMGYDFMDEVDNKISVVKYLSNFTDQSSYKTQLYGMNAKILKSNFSADAAKRAVRLNYTFDNENVVDVFQAASTITGGALSDQQIRADFKNGVRWPNILIGGN